MRTLRPRLLAVTGTFAALTALCVGGGSVPAYGADLAAQAVTTSYRVNGSLLDVAAVSRTDAWAVGFTGLRSPRTLLLHWNGSKWSPVTSPKPVPGTLMGLTKVSKNDIWAVGDIGTSKVRPLVLHWNGKSWKRVAGVPTLSAEFSAIGEAGKVLLAVGGLSAPPMLNMERTGGTWKRLPVPSAPGALVSLAVTGARSAWAAGDKINSKYFPYGDVLLHWNGTAWRSVSFPLQGTNRNLWHLSAGAGGAVWAVGDSHNNALTQFTPLSMTWNGKTWRKAAIHAPANSALIGVTFVPGGTAWAVGAYNTGKLPLILRWTGKAWSRVAAPSPSSSSYLDDVAATSPGDAWAVGTERDAKSFKTFILHWNGRTWS